MKGRYFQIVVLLFIKDVKDAMFAYCPFVLLYYVINVWGFILIEVKA